MRIEVSYLQRTECYPCMRQEARAAFGDLGLWWIGLGHPYRHFKFFSRDTRHSKVAEQDIVAKGAYSAQRDGWFSAYAVRRDAYPPQAREDFRARVLAEIRHWLRTQMAKPDTAVLGYECFIVEWDGTTHNFHYYTLR